MMFSFQAQRLVALCLLFSTFILLTYARHQLVFTAHRPMAFGRMDAIVNPGELSSHPHFFIGANNPSPSSDFASLRAANCSTMPFGKVDLSSYWSPSIYHRAAGGTAYTLLTDVRFAKVYYNLEGDETPFPDNFRMVVGSPKAKTHNCKNGTPTSPTCNHNDHYWYCGGGNSEHSQESPRRHCAFVGFHITFPNCWSGKEFTLANQDEHVFYQPKGSAKCGPGLIRLPQLMYSFMFLTENIVPNGADEDTYVLSTNTEGGYGVHADFINGWDPDVQKKMLEQCSALPKNNPEGCPALAPYFNKKAAEQCQFDGLLPTEDLGIEGHSIPTIPGAASMTIAANLASAVSDAASASCNVGWAAPVDFTADNLLPVAANGTCAAASTFPGVVSPDAVVEQALPTPVARSIPAASSVSTPASATDDEVDSYSGDEQVDSADADYDNSATQSTPEDALVQDPSGGTRNSNLLRRSSTRRHSHKRRNDLIGHTSH